MIVKCQAEIAAAEAASLSFFEPSQDLVAFR
jgi:hypothetical protein